MKHLSRAWHRTGTNLIGADSCFLIVEGAMVRMTILCVLAVWLTEKTVNGPQEEHDQGTGLVSTIRIPKVFD